MAKSKSKAKTQTQKAKRSGRKQCAEKGCRKLQAEGSKRCREHQAAAGGNGVPGRPAVPDGVVQLSEIDLLRFVRTDTELHNHKLEIRNLEQEHVIDQAGFEQRRAVRQNRIKLLQQSIRQREVQQRALIEELGKKYGFDHTIASIDDETGAVHEHPPGK